MPRPRPGQSHTAAHRNSNAASWRRLSRAHSAANIQHSGMRRTASKQPRGVVDSFQSTTSWGSKEQFYHHQWRKYNRNKLRVPEERRAKLKNAQSEPTLSEGVHKWMPKLRSTQSTTALRRQKRAKRSVKRLPKELHPLTKSESKLWEHRVEAWKKSRGNHSSAESQVTPEEFHEHFPSFHYIARDAGRLSPEDLSRVAKALGVATSENEVKKATDVLDQDSSGKLKFHEMMLSLRKLKNEDTQPFIGGRRGMPVDIMLMHYHRRCVMDKALTAVTDDMQHRMYLAARSSFLHESRRAAVCKKCFEEFDTTPELEEHMRERHVYRNEHGHATHFTCRQCGGINIPVAEKQNHLAKHRLMVKDGFKCRHCKLVFHSGAALSYHMRQKHTPLALDVFGCQFCAEAFSTLEQMHEHQDEFHRPQHPQITRRPSLRRSASAVPFRRSIRVADRDGEEWEDMDKQEYDEMRHKFYQRSRHRLADKVRTMKHIQAFRREHGDNCRVSRLAELFVKHEHVTRFSNSRISFLADRLDTLLGDRHR